MALIFGRQIFNSSLHITSVKDSIDPDEVFLNQIDHPKVERIGEKMVQSLVTYINPTDDLVNELKEKTICFIIKRTPPLPYGYGYREEYDFIIDIVITTEAHYKDCKNYQKIVELFQKHGYKKHKLSL